LPEVASGDLAVVLIGEGSESDADPIREAIAGLDRRAIVRLAGYRQGPALRAAYSKATALVFASTCESFGIPAVEAMAQHCPVALANSTALPEVGGESAWYFDPEDESAIASTIRDLLDHPDERRRRSEIGRSIAEGYRWSRSTELLVSALREASCRPKRVVPRPEGPGRSWKKHLDRLGPLLDRFRPRRDQEL
jgi:alpha-1,3-rhamnosyl/mannosyltransferase